MSHGPLVIRFGSLHHNTGGPPRTNGTLVIQTNQPQYLAGAWAQVAGIRAANAALRSAQLAREAAVQLFARHFTVRSDVAVVAVTAPVHARILN